MFVGPYIYIISLPTVKFAAVASPVQATHVQRANCWRTQQPHGQTVAFSLTTRKTVSSVPVVCSSAHHNTNSDQK